MLAKMDYKIGRGWLKSIIIKDNMQRSLLLCGLTSSLAKRHHHRTGWQAEVVLGAKEMTKNQFIENCMVFLPIHSDIKPELFHFCSTSLCFSI